MLGLFSKKKTFRVRKKHKNERHKNMHKHAKATLGKADALKAVKVPEGEEKNEWLAVNTIDFYNVINMLYGSLQELCTNETCPEMNAGDEYSYLWIDPPKIKKPIKLSAPEYVESLMVWVEGKIGDRTIFPSEEGDEYPKDKDYHKELVQIYKRLFRVFAHIYYQHFEQIKGREENEHLDKSFKHFMYFCGEFRLVPPKELTVMKEYIELLLGKYGEKMFKKKKKKRKRKKK